MVNFLTMVEITQESYDFSRGRFKDWEDTHIEYTIRLLRNEENKRKVITDRANELLLEIYKMNEGGS